MNITHLEEEVKKLRNELDAAKVSINMLNEKVSKLQKESDFGKRRVDLHEDEFKDYLMKESNLEDDEAFNISRYEEQMRKRHL